MPHVSRRRFISTGAAGSIRDVKHVVVVMQENRSFDHYYESLGGVRGFGDDALLR